MTDTNQNKLIDEKQAAQRLGCTISFLRRCRLLLSGPPYVKIGRLVRYSPAALDAYIESNTVQAQGLQTA